MCGRYVHPDEAALEREFNLTGPRVPDPVSQHFKDNYNVAPASKVPVVRMQRVVRMLGPEREVLTMRWGLVPFFAKGIAGPYSTINARMETLKTQPSYRGPWKRGQRCLIPARGFYEWQAQPPDWQRTVAHYITCNDQEIFALAGLWDESVTEAGAAILSCTIVTMPANELMAQVHNSKKAGKLRVLLPPEDRRMPAILARENRDAWLNGTADEAWACLAPYPSGHMVAWPVSAKVGSTRNNSPDLLLPVGN